MLLRRALLLYLVGFCSLCASPARALVEPEVEGWQAMVEAARPVCEVPGSELLPEALEELGALGSALASAPLDDIMIELEQRRGLKFKYFTPWHVKDRNELRAFLQKHLSQEMPSQKVAETEAMLTALGLVPESFKLMPFLEELYTSQIAGVYDPAADQFFLVDMEAGRSFRDRAFEGARDGFLASAGLSMGDQSAIVTIHELDHALGGQYFPLKEVFEEAAKGWSTDRQMAAQALVEGDATFVMIDYQNKSPAKDMGANTQVLGAEMMAKMVGMMAMFPIPLPGMGAFGEAPLYFQKGLMFPYFNGAELVTQLRHSQADWSAVDAAYGQLPTSTEQIYHPSDYQYVARPAKIPDLSRLPNNVGTWSKVVDDTGGEFLVRVVLEQHGVADFAGAAEGWNGDRLRVYRDPTGEKLAFVWQINWDSVGDAQEFHASAQGKLPFEIQPSPTATLLSSGLDDQASAAAASALGIKP